MASIFLNGGTNGRSMNQGGHGGPIIYGGRGLIYKHDFNGSFGGLSTFNSSLPDGNRCLTFAGRNAQHWHMEQCVLNRNGVPPDTSPSGTSELCKLEGSDNAILDTVHRNSVSHAYAIDSADWSIHARRGRLGHNVYQNFNGPIAIMRDWLDEGYAGNTRLSDYQWKNCIIDQIALAPYSSWVNHILLCYISSGMDWTNCVQMHGITVRDSAGRTGDDFLVTIDRAAGGGGVGTRSITYMLANYPANFSNWTFVTANPFSTSLAAATNITANDIATYYTPNTLANGVSLTLANGAGVATTTLVVDDSRWFTDPRYGTSPQVHINGVGNRSYTAINYATHTLTLSAVATWADNAPVNRAITSGATPNRGAVR
jgi:hypothetical protein